MAVGLITPYWDTVTTTAIMIGIIAVGLYVSNAAGALSVAHAALAGIGGYVGAVLTSEHGWPFAVALVAGGLISLIFGVLLAIVTLRMNPLVAGLTTLAFGETMVVVALNFPGLGGATGLYGVPAHTTELLAAAILVVVLLGVWGFERSRMGLAARAVRDNGPAAAAMGVNLVATKICTFAIGAGIAGVGGVLTIHYVLVQQPAALDFQASLPIVIIWVFGGSYTFLGPVFGAFILTIVPETLRFSNEARYMLYGLLLVAFVIARPTGVVKRVPLGVTPRWLAWVGRRTRRPSSRQA